MQFLQVSKLKFGLLIICCLHSYMFQLRNLKKSGYVDEYYYSSPLLKFKLIAEELDFLFYSESLSCGDICVFCIPHTCFNLIVFVDMFAVSNLL